MQNSSVFLLILVILFIFLNNLHLCLVPFWPVISHIFLFRPISAVAVTVFFPLRLLPVSCPGLFILFLHELFFVAVLLLSHSISFLTHFPFALFLHALIQNCRLSSPLFLWIQSLHVLSPNFLWVEHFIVRNVYFLLQFINQWLYLCFCEFLQLQLFYNIPCAPGS